MTGPPKTLLSEHSTPRIQIERGVCFLENSPWSTERQRKYNFAFGRRSDGTRFQGVAALDAVSAGGPAPPAMCAGAKATLEIQHNERCAPPRGQARRTEQYRPSSIHRRNSWAVYFF
jgi:hypothetical protein